jgi:RsiW-degrading membrane proteinase PrsW (M82 family)
MSFPLLPAAISLLPVGAFLGGLVYLDSYKLVGIRAVLYAMAAGCAAAGVAMAVNPLVVDFLGVDAALFTRYGAPLVEESLKASYLFWLFSRGRIGFMVDGAIYGFAIGAGFSVVENTFYLQAVASTNPLLWVVSGFGTAIMHGGVCAIVGALARSLLDRHPDRHLSVFLPGLLLAAAVHSLFNHFFLSPVMSAGATIVGVPVVMVLVFRYSEQSTRGWLGAGFDNDQQLLEMLTSGVLSETPVGTYLHSLEERFSPPVVADMLCLLRLHVELSIQAKGVLLLREAGFAPAPDPEIAAHLAEMTYLERSIGKTGMIALLPFLHGADRAGWQKQMMRS